MAPKRKRASTNPIASERPSRSGDHLVEEAMAQGKADTSSTAHDQVDGSSTSKPSRSSKTGKSKATNTEAAPEDTPMANTNTPQENGLHVEKAEMKANDGDDATVKIEQPPKAGIVDPVGFHTNPPPEGRTVRVYADGVFDLFHLGHMRQLQQAKTAFPSTKLIVGVAGDSDTHARKGLTVLSAAERAETVRHCRWVDEVIPDCPWVVSAEFLEEHNIDYVAHDDMPYGAAEGDDIYKPIKEQGKFLVTQRTEGVSTTGIITKIVRDYNNYVGRQLKRGASRKELNVSWLKKNELDLKRHVAELRNSFKTNWSSTGVEFGRDLKGFWDRSRPASPAPSIRGMSRGGARPQLSGSDGAADAEKSPPASAVAHLGHLDIPRSPTESRGDSPRNVSDFAAGYSMGLVGSIRSWMLKTRRNVGTDSGVPSPEASEDSEESGKDDINEEADGAEDRQGRKRVRVT
ncbi:MAG: hypothetical protein M1828_000358 [Chrysothrix sp. TS-e1954]|nr:MAG: hypothetical protein M1828_000358 [Chrysothrix sp. TS-e1954]